MNKKGKKLCKIIGAILGLVLLLVGVCLVKLYVETRKMTPVGTGEILEGVYAVRDGYVNLFLIKAGQAYIAFDAGNNADHIQKELSRMNIDPGMVAAVFLTHSDADHTAGLGLFPNAAIYISKQEEQMINGRTTRLLIVKNKIKQTCEFLEDNQILAISGVNVRGILMPGHTPGSMNYLINDGLLFAGDSMSLKDGKILTFNDMFNMDSKTHEMSLRKLALVSGVNYILTAHYGITKISPISFDAWKE